MQLQDPFREARRTLLQEIQYSMTSCRRHHEASSQDISHSKTIRAPLTKPIIMRLSGHSKTIRGTTCTCTSSRAVSTPSVQSPTPTHLRNHHHLKNLSPLPSAANPPKIHPDQKPLTNTISHARTSSPTTAKPLKKRDGNKCPPNAAIAPSTPPTTRLLSRPSVRPKEIIIPPERPPTQTERASTQHAGPPLVLIWL